MWIVMSQMVMSVSNKNVPNLIDLMSCQNIKFFDLANILCIFWRYVNFMSLLSCGNLLNIGPNWTR